MVLHDSWKSELTASRPVFKHISLLDVYIILVMVCEKTIEDHADRSGIESSDLGLYQQTKKTMDVCLRHLQSVLSGKMIAPGSEYNPDPRLR
jgi:hypothetical protein